MIGALIAPRLMALGPLLAAVAIVAGMVLVICALVAGLWWLRADAARDARAAERHQCNIERALANQEALEAQAAADRAAAEAAHQARAAWLEALTAARDRAAELELLLTQRPARVICYPRDVARALNR
ncbi:MAG: hypothetical protein ACK4TL_20090 [Hyphomicrobiaceae bacterium]